MPPAYIPLLLFSLLVLAFPVVTLIVFKSLRPGSRGGPAKFQPYECGILPETSTRGRYFARFYIIAMLFMILNVETIFLLDRKSTRLNSSHTVISYAVFCLKKKLSALTTHP